MLNQNDLLSKKNLTVAENTLYIITTNNLTLIKTIILIMFS